MYYQPVILGAEHGVTFGGPGLYEMDLDRLEIVAVFDYKASVVYKIRTSKLGKYLEGHDRLIVTVKTQS
jgi:hypothetical protein